MGILEDRAAAERQAQSKLLFQALEEIRRDLTHPNEPITLAEAVERLSHLPVKKPARRWLFGSYSCPECAEVVIGQWHSYYWYSSCKCGWMYAKSCASYD